MSKITLYYTPLSPPSRTILTVAEAIGLDLEKKNVDLFKGEHLTPEYTKIVPQRTVPAIVDNGTVIYESHAIAGYLCDNYAKDDSLYPRDSVQRARVNARLHYDTGNLFAHLDYLWFEIFEHGAIELPTKILANIKKCYNTMERFLENGKFLCGDNLSIADISCITSLTSMDTFLPIEEETYPKLTKWIETMKAFPFYEANREGAKLCQDIMWDKFKENQAKQQ